MVRLNEPKFEEDFKVTTLYGAQQQVVLFAPENFNDDFKKNQYYLMELNGKLTTFKLRRTKKDWMFEEIAEEDFIGNEAVEE